MCVKRVNVAITANAPFLDYDFNTSLMVRDALPEVIERANKCDIRLLRYARATHDTYHDIRRVSREIWTGQRSLFLPELKPDEDDTKLEVSFILHLGMEIRKEEFCFETRARRDGYEKPGEDGEYVDSAHMKEMGLPEVLTTSFDVKKAAEVVKDKFPDVQSRVSDDAGLYFCEFRLFSSLAEAELRHHENRGRVLFEHIPQKHDSDAIEQATRLTIAYIEALVDNDNLGL